jgi:hypothetical protein
MALVRSLIRKKKFFRYLVDKRYPIAIDRTQKCVRDVLWSEHCLERGTWEKATIPACTIMSMWWRPVWHLPAA